MIRTPEVHWHEGLFLQPHHLQMAQRRASERLSGLHRLLLPFPYGVIESEIDPEDLADNRVLRFRRLHAILKDGSEVNVPDETDLPALRFEREFQEGGELTAYLAVPVYDSGRANVIDEKGGERRQKRMYWVDEYPWADENTARNEQQVRVRRVNARLTFSNVDGDFEYLALLRITRGAGARGGDTPVEDTSFIPPCLHLGGSSLLANLVGSIVHVVEATRKQYVGQRPWAVEPGEAMTGTKVGDFLAGLAMSRYSALLSGLTAAPSIPPFSVYLVLRELVAELSLLYPDKGSFDTQPYDHEALAFCFQDARERIKRLTESTIAQEYREARFGVVTATAVRVVFHADLAPQDFSEPIEFFLGIQSPEPPATVQQLAMDQDRVKLLPKGRVELSVRGIRLEHEAFPPPFLRPARGLQFFRILKDRMEQFWKEMRRDGTLALTGPAGVEKWTVTLYMILSEKK